VTNNSLHSDAALADPDEDELGYNEFAADLADLIKEDVPQNGFVVSINGPWGSGKSTVLNFLETELSDGHESPTIVRFNPWWFSGEADLIQRYLEELAAALAEGEQYSELREKLANYANAVSKVPFDAMGVPVNRAAAGAASLMRPEETTTSELKSSIETTISDEYDQIVVFIDEIDRLTNRETSQVFKLVKSVADFPNTTYVLAFSREVVTDALQADENPHRVENGAEYLDKIVQLPRRVPVPKHGSLGRMLEKGLQQIAPDDISVDGDRASKIINEILSIVDTPRDVNRLLNSVRSSHRVLDGEVNFLDIVALEALKEHAEPVYESIRRDPESFALLSVNEGRLPGSGTEDTLDEDMSVQVENLLSATFPHWREETFVMSDEMEFNYREANRAAHPDQLHRYLRKTVPESQYSSVEIANIIRATDDSEQFTSKLRDEFLDSDSEPLDNRVLLSELVASRDKIRDSEAVLSGIFNVADELIRLDDRAHATFETHTATYLLYLYRFAANNLHAEPTQNIKSAMRDGDSLYFPQYICSKQGSESADLDIRHCQHTPELQSLSEILLELARQKIETNTLVDVPRLWRVMELLDHEDDDQFVSDWLESVATSQDRLPRFLVGFTRTGRINGQPVYYIDATELGEYVDLDTVQATVLSLVLENFDEREQRAIENFQTAMELIEDGQEPGNLENWSSMA
jgi:hypothetical protein